MSTINSVPCFIHGTSYLRQNEVIKSYFSSKTKRHIAYRTITNLYKIFLEFVFKFRKIQENMFKFIITF